MSDAILRLARWSRAVVPRTVVDRIRPVYWRMVSRAAGERGVAVRFSDGHRYRVEPHLFSWQLDRYEPEVVTQLTNLVTADSVVYDIGAHVGLIALMMAARVRRPAGRVYAFEPSPANLALLRRHIAINGCEDRVLVVPRLVGDREEAAVPFSCRPGEFTANSMAYMVDGGVSTVVEMVTIDRFVHRGEAPPPAVMKIDVEGFEGAVLRGARDVLRQYRPAVVCAMHPEPLRMLHETPEGVVAWMREIGYRATRLNGAPTNAPGFEEVVFRG